ncbi:hypothetical protein Nepgr_013170 [Nepenthes gracilis]|uniref:RNA polymerase II subunit B1 CTD phosphatase RPAP2 homolog n=1 Tax=Nepenthes gracilis TaxID=150966 RepID=A0AAD3SIL8_NEPGR|nr:hypothetical protein Nepgr_013170 [Nepenthes gracilis]
MAEDPITSVNEAVHKLQLCLLEGIQDENQLFAAGSLMSRSDYEDVVTERSICNMCGYPLCNKSLPSERPRRGRYRISLKEHKVYDLHETYMYCSTSCVICSRAFAGSLQDERCSTFNTAKINEILNMFENTNLESDTDPGKSEDLGLSELKIHEKTDFKGGEVSLKKWIGPPNAIEGYVPKRDHTYTPLKSETCKEGDENDSKARPLHAETSKPFLNEMDFKSTILTHDEQGVSKKFPENVSNLMPLHSKAQKKGSKHKKSDLKKGMDTIFNDVDFSSAIITQDEYVISKTPVPADTFSNQRSKGSEENSCIVGASDRFTVSKESSVTMHNDSDMMLMNSSAAQIGSITTDKSTLTDVSSYHSQNGPKSAVDGVKEIHAEKSVQSSKTTTKSSLKSKGVKKVAHSVSWMDEKNGSLNGRNLCEVQELRNMKEGSETFKSTEIGNDDLEQLASAKACATALDQAAEAVESGVSRVTGAASETGIILFPQQLETDGRKCLDKVSRLEAEPAPVKWPRKSGLSDAECFDSKDSWFDAPPEGFSLTLSPFATMWNALFTWITSSSLAYIYGRAERFQGEYMFVNGREYPQKIVLPDGRSSEIKQTLAGFLAQALPSVIGDLKLPIPTSTLEQGLGNLLETMSFLDALPPFRVKQWQVIVLLFIDALSVCQIPRLAPHLTNRRMIIPKVLEGTQISLEEYKAMKDLIIPLDQAP